MYNLYFLYFLIFMLGASFASFVGVYVERGNVKGRSICANCLKQLNFFELIPIFSFLFLKGRCRKCKTKIPVKLLYYEIILGLYFLYSFFYFLGLQQGKIYFFLSLIFASIFFMLTIEDMENMEVSSFWLNVLVGVGILKAIITLIYLNNYYELLFSLLVITPFWIIYFIGKATNKKLLGEADPYIFLSLALFFGVQFTLSLFIYSVWLGAAYGIFYLIFINKKFERGVVIPFLPIIFIATLFILITNFHIIKIADILLLNDYFF